MPIFFTEDRREVQNKVSVLPKSFIKDRINTAILNQDYLDTVPGGKVLKGIISPTNYNTKAKGTDNNDEKKSTIGLIKHSRLKGIVHAMEQVPRNSKSFELYGGEKGLEIYRNILSKNRAVPPVNQVKSVKPSSASSSTKPASSKLQKIEKPNGGTITFNENRNIIYLNEKQLKMIKNNL